MISNEITDLELLRRLRLNDDSALTTLYKKYWNNLYRSAYRILKDHNLCEDVLQDIFVNLWLARKIEVRVSLKSYLYASVRYEVFKQIRKSKSHEEITDYINHVELSIDHVSLEYKELQREISRLTEELPERSREVFKLSRLEHLSHKEIATKLSISSKTVEYHISKALKFFSEHLEKLIVLLIFMG